MFNLKIINVKEYKRKKSKFSNSPFNLVYLLLLRSNREQFILTTFYHTFAMLKTLTCLIRGVHRDLLKPSMKPFILLIQVMNVSFVQTVSSHFYTTRNNCGLSLKLLKAFLCFRFTFGRIEWDCRHFYRIKH